MLRHRLLRHQSSAGFTLLELVLSAALFGIVVLGVGNLSVNALNTYAYLQAQSNSAADLTNVIGRVSKVVRGTTGIIDAQTNTLTIYAYFSPNDAVVDKVRYFVSGTTLQVGVTPPSGSGPVYTYLAANEKLTTLAQNLAMGSTPVFSYYDDAGTTLPVGFTLSQIRQIGVAIAINPNTKRLPVPISNQTIVTLRNMKTNL